MVKSIYLLVFLLIIPFVISVGYDNSALYGIRPLIETSGGGGGAGNVSSVTSSTNCLIINPTTGDVVITFNTSCAATGGSGTDNHTLLINLDWDVAGHIMNTVLEMNDNNIEDVFNLTMIGDIVSNNDKNGSNLFLLNSSATGAVTLVAAHSDVGFATLVSVGSQIDLGVVDPVFFGGADFETTQNDSGLFCSGGRCFILNDGADDIVMGHILRDDGNFSNATLSLVIGNDGTVTMQGPLRLNSEEIFFDFDDDHFVRVNIDSAIFGGDSTNATWFGHNRTRESGEVTYIFSHDNKTNLWMTSEKNNSYSAVGDSFGVVPSYMGIDNFTENGVINMTRLSSYLEICETFDFPCFFFADTRGNPRDKVPGRPLLFTMGDFETWGQSVIHGGELVLDDFDVILNGLSQVNIFNGSLHIADPTTFISGFVHGEELKVLQAIFPGTILPFVNDQMDPGNWMSSPFGLCDSGECGRASAVGLGNISMTSNFNTININETQLSFIYSLSQFVGAATFRVFISNTSTTELLFSDTTNNIFLEREVIELNDAWDNQTNLNLTFMCDFDATIKPERECFVDTVIVNGTFQANTTATVNDFNSEWCVGDGTTDSNGDCNKAWFYDAETNQMLLRGATLNASGTIVGGVSGSGTVNTLPKWVGATSIGNSNLEDNGSVVTIGAEIDASGSDLTIDQVNAISVNVSDNSNFLRSYISSGISRIEFSAQLLIRELNDNIALFNSNLIDFFVPVDLNGEDLIAVGDMDSQTITTENVIINEDINGTFIDIGQGTPRTTILSQFSANNVYLNLEGAVGGNANVGDILPCDGSVREIAYIYGVIVDTGTFDVHMEFRLDNVKQFDLPLSNEPVAIYDEVNEYERYVHNFSKGDRMNFMWDADGPTGSDERRIQNTAVNFRGQCNEN